MSIYRHQLNLAANEVAGRNSIAATELFRTLQKYGYLTKLALRDGYRLGWNSVTARQQATDKYYVDDSSYCSDDYNLGGFADWELSFVDEFLPTRGRILVPAAGGGREAIALARRGFRVTAFDCNKVLVNYAARLAKDHQLDISILHSLPDTLPKLEHSFTGCLIGWGAYMHIMGSNERIDFLRAIRGVLQPGAPLLVSFLTRRPQSRYFLLVKLTASLLRLVKPGRAPLELGDTMDDSCYHYFVEEEISKELASAGYLVRRFETDPYGHAIAVVR